MNGFNLQSFLSRWYKIRPSEFLLVQLLLLYLTAISSFYVVGVSAGETLFLSQLDITTLKDLLPWIFISIAVATIFITWLYSNFINKLSRIKLIVTCDILIAISLIIFRFLLNLDPVPKWVYFSLIVWIEACSEFKIVLFYSYMGDYFSSSDARRVYSYILIGTALGSMAGGLFTLIISRYIQVQNLLYIAILILLLTSVIGYSISLIAKPRPHDINHKRQQEIPVKDLLANSYLKIIFLIGITSAISFVIADYQMLITASQEISGTELATFFGKFFMLIGLAQLGIETLVGTWLLTRFGVIKNLFLLPLLLLVQSLLFMGYPSLFFATSSNFTYLVLSETLDISSRQLLFLPLPYKTRIYSTTLASGILEPAGKIIIALILFVYALWNTPIQIYTPTLCVVAISWLTLIFLLKKRYQKTLANTLRTRKLYSDELQIDIENFKKTLTSPGNDSIVKTLLEEPDTTKLLFLLDMLPEKTMERLKPSLLKLLARQDHAITIFILKSLGRIGTKQDLAIVAKFLEDDHAEIVAVALSIYCQLAGDLPVEIFDRYLQSTNILVKSASLTCYFKYGGSSRKTIVKREVTNLINSNPLGAVKIISEIDDPKLNAKLNTLLLHSNEDVRHKAIQVVKEKLDPQFIPNLIQNLIYFKSSFLEVRQTLFAMPQSAAPKLIVFFEKKNLPDKIRNIILAVLGKIGGTSSLTLLLKIITNKKYSPLLLLGIKQGLQFFNSTVVLSNNLKETLRNTLQIAYENLRVIKEAYLELPPQPNIRMLFYDTFYYYAEIYFLQLSIYYGLKEMGVATSFLEHIKDKKLGSEVLEFLEASVSRVHFAEITELFTPPLRELPPLRTSLQKSTLKKLLKLDSWISALTSFYLSNINVGFKDIRMKPIDPLLATRISSILLLKKIELFNAIPTHYLLGLSEIIHEDHFFAGQYIFKEGDSGDSLYLITQGKVSIQTDSEEVCQLREGECLGEMALLDKLPRSASAIAIEETHLLRIDAQDFEEVLLAYPEVGLSLLKILSRRLRSLS